MLVLAARASLATLVVLALWARVPTLFGCDAVVVDGGSMRPALRPGDVAVACPARDLHVGAVVLADDPGRPGQLLTHRIVAVDHSRVTLQGDANRSRDQQPVPRRAVHGVVRLVVPMIGRPARWLAHDDWPRVAAAAAALLLLIALCAAEAIAALLRRGDGSSRRRARSRRAGAQAGVAVDIGADEPLAGAGAPP